MLFFFAINATKAETTTARRNTHRNSLVRKCAINIEIYTNIRKKEKTKPLLHDPGREMAPRSGMSALLSLLCTRKFLEHAKRHSHIQPHQRRTGTSAPGTRTNSIRKLYKHAGDAGYGKCNDQQVCRRISRQKVLRRM